MVTSPNQHRYTLAEDGDSRERRWAEELLRGFESYETIWAAHIVPLTFRNREPDNHYLRPSVSKPLLNLADAADATFFQLSECHAWAHRMRKVLDALKSKGEAAAWPLPDETGIVPSEALYCFFRGKLLDQARTVAKMSQ